MLPAESVEKNTPQQRALNHHITLELDTMSVQTSPTEIWQSSAPFWFPPSTDHRVDSLHSSPSDEVWQTFQMTTPTGKKKKKRLLVFMLQTLKWHQLWHVGAVRFVSLWPFPKLGALQGRLRCRDCSVHTIHSFHAAGASSGGLRAVVYIRGRFDMTLTCCRQ